jgi:hypothetical protein
VLVTSGNERISTLVRILTVKITELEKLQKAGMQATETT